jgi:hypothetical protein
VVSLFVWMPSVGANSTRTNRTPIKADSTLRTSRAVPHPSTNRALCRLTSEVERDPVHSTRYGRQRENMERPVIPQASKAPKHCSVSRRSAMLAAARRPALVPADADDHRHHRRNAGESFLRVFLKMHLKSTFFSFRVQLGSQS